MRPLRVHLPGLLLASTLAWAGPMSTASASDYAPSSRTWNGLSRLVELAADAGVRLETPSELDLGRLTSQDALLLVYPQRQLPRSSLAALLRSGGRVAIADDFGTAEPLLSLYGIERSELGGKDVSHLRGNPQLPLAEPRRGIRHPLSKGVRALVTNHPAALAHDELQPLFQYGESGGAAVLAGAVEQGRLVAIGDPSVLINNMLQFRGNRRFARNLLQYLAEGGGRVVLVTADTPITGSWGQAGGPPVQRAQQWLGSLAEAEIPPLALQLVAVMLVALLVVVASSSLPRRSPYDGRAVMARRAPDGGFVGRVAFFLRRRGHLLHPLLVYKQEFEAELADRLGLTLHPSTRRITEAMRAQGLAEERVQQARSLLSELDALQDRQDRPPDPPRVTEARFHRMVQTGERILNELPPPESSASQAPSRRNYPPTFEKLA